MKKIDSTSSLRAFIKPQAKVVDMPSQAILAGSTTNSLSMGKTTSQGGSLTYAPSTAD